MKSIRHIFTLLISILLISVAAISFVSAASETQIDQTGKYKYYLWTDQFGTCAYVVEYMGTPTDLVLTSEVDGVEADWSEFPFDKANMTCISISKDFTFDPDFESLIYDCPNLTDIYIEQGNEYYKAVDGVLYTTGGELLFYPRGKKSESYNVASGTKDIGYNSFYYNPYIKEVILPDGLERIEITAFNSCTSLEKLSHFPETVNYTCECGEIFYNCKSLNEIEYLGTKSQFIDICSIGRIFGHLEDGLKIVKCLGSSTDGSFEYEYDEELDGVIITDYTGSGTKLTIPETLGGYTVKKLYYTFYKDTSIVGVTLPSGVTTAGDRTFYGCTTLRNVDFVSATNIGNEALYGCKNLQSLTLPEGLKSIGDYAFRDCIVIDSVCIPKSMTSLGTGVFYGCTSIGTITVADGNSSFCAEDNILFDKEKTSIYLYAPQKTTASYSVPETVTQIEAYAFSGNTHVTSISDMPKVKLIGNYAFYGCTSLQSVLNIGKTLKEIKNSAFGNCSSITSASYQGTKDQWGTVRLGEGNTYLTNKLGYSYVHNHPACGLTCDCEDATHSNVTWTAWDGKTSINNYAYYYLTEDVNRTTAYTITGTVHICLNGHKLSTSGNVPGFNVAKGATLFLCDCIGKGSISSTKDNSTQDTDETAIYNQGTVVIRGCSLLGCYGIYNDENTTAKIYDSTITGKSAGILNEGGSVELYNCKISGTDTNSIGIDNSGSLVIKDSTVSGTRYGIDNGSSKVGNIAVSCSITNTRVSGKIGVFNNELFTMESGTINSSSAYSEYNKCAIDNHGTFTMNGGKAYTCGQASTIANYGIVHLNGGQIYTSYYSKQSLPSFPINSAYMSARGDRSEAYVAVLSPLDAHGNGVTVQSSICNASSTAKVYISGSPAFDVIDTCANNSIILKSEDGTLAYTGNGFRIKIYVSGYAAKGIAVKDVPAEIADSISRINVQNEISEEGGYLEGKDGNIYFIKIITSGKCGANANYTIDGNNILKITGTGAIYDSQSNGSARWGMYYTKIEKVIFGEGINHIGTRCFSGCTALKEIVFSETNLDMGDYAFYSCDALESVVIPKNVKLGYAVFSQCAALKNAELSCSVVPSYTFELCTNMEEIKLNEGVETISDYAFKRTDKVETIVFPTTVKSIGKYNFSVNDLGNNTQKLKDVYIKSATTSIDATMLEYMPSGITIHGYTCSTAHKYASDKSLTFVALENDNTHTIVNDASKEANCVHTGLTAGSHCSVCGMVFTKQETIAIDADGHDFGTVSYEWFEENDVWKCKALRTCKNDTSHVDQEIVTGVYTVVSNPTKTDKGEGKYTATFESEAFTDQIKTVEIACVVLDHIEITTPTSINEYMEGQKFDATGMVVKAYYDNGSSEVVTDYTIDLTGALKRTDEKVTVSFEGKTAEQDIVVYKFGNVSRDRAADGTEIINEEDVTHLRYMINRSAAGTLFYDLNGDGFINECDVEVLRELM